MTLRLVSDEIEARRAQGLDEARSVPSERGTRAGFQGAWFCPVSRCLLMGCRSAALLLRNGAWLVRLPVRRVEESLVVLVESVVVIELGGAL